MDKDKETKARIAINKLLNKSCLAIDIDSLHCPEGKNPCERCSWHNESTNFSKVTI